MSEGFGAIISNLDLRSLHDQNVKQKIYEIFLDRHVVCLRGCSPSPKDFAKISREFGEPQVQLLNDYHLDGYSEISLISNYNKIGGTTPHFAEPAKATLLCAQALPSFGGETAFINCHSVLEDMPATLRCQFEGRRATHKYFTRRNKARVAERNATEKASTPDVSHPLVRRHPETKRLSLYINPNRIDHIQGIPSAESDKLLDDIYAFAFQERFQHQHSWRVGDILMWDNRCTMHRATTNFDISEPREFMRILLKGDIPV